MYAIIASGGKQYRVEKDTTLRMEKISGEVGDVVSFDKVLMFADGDQVAIGQPILENVTVTGRIVDQNKAKKIIVFKYKRRKRFRRKQGHRQPFTAVKIEAIEAA
ncbi:MAG: 50S ribosomal protein L21 [Thermodesulfobacteriota bacterium]|nr:50S ribosomal protein L21 [Thermodesulfobacteriota bacterium]